jgi:hypothetical protein
VTLKLSGLGSKCKQFCGMVTKSFIDETSEHMPVERHRLPSASHLSGFSQANFKLLVHEEGLTKVLLSLII